MENIFDVEKTLVELNETTDETIKRWQKEVKMNSSQKEVTECQKCGEDVYKGDGDYSMCGNCAK